MESLFGERERSDSDVSQPFLGGNYSESGS